MAIVEPPHPVIPLSNMQLCGSSESTSLRYFVPDGIWMVVVVFVYDISTYF